MTLKFEDGLWIGNQVTKGPHYTCGSTREGQWAYPYSSRGIRNFNLLRSAWLPSAEGGVRFNLPHLCCKDLTSNRRVEMFVVFTGGILSMPYIDIWHNP